MVTNRRNFLTAAAAMAAPVTRAAAAPARRALLRPAICAYSFRKELAAKTMSYEDLVRLAAGLDVDGLDLTVYWFPSTDGGFLLPLKRLAYKHGIDIYSISVRTVMTRATPEQREKELADLRKWVDVAVKLGARHVRVFGGDVPKGTNEDDAATWVVEVLKRGGEYAGANGVILGLENHGGITARAERIIDIVKRVDSPWVAVNLDTGNFRTDPLPQIEQCIPYAANVQVKANTEWDRIIGMLASAGYRGYLALEYEAAEPAPSAVPKLIGKLRELCGKYS